MSIELAEPSTQTHPSSESDRRVWMAKRKSKNLMAVRTPGREVVEVQAITSWQHH